MSAVRMPLAGVLRLRGLERDRAAQELAAQARKVAQLEEQGRELRESLGLVPVEAPDAMTLHAIAAARASAGRMLVDLQALQQVQQAAIESAAQRHREARSRHRGIERLVEQRAAAAAVEELGRDQLQIDEIAITTWLRSVPERGA